MKMFLKIFASMALLATLSLSSPAFAEGETCSVVERRLVCADGSKDIAKIAMAMANPETKSNIISAGPGHVTLAGGKEREKFRVSVERARKAMQRHADRQFRKYRRRKISAEDYEAVRVQFESGMENYFEAIKLYRQTRWFGPEKN